MFCGLANEATSQGGTRRKLWNAKDIIVDSEVNRNSKVVATLVLPLGTVKGITKVLEGTHEYLCKLLSGC